MLAPPPNALSSSSPSLPPPFAAGLLFGASPHTLTRAPLSLFATVGHKSDELLSHAGSKKGGMKKGVAVRAGPVMKIAGLHSDGQPIQLQLQATAREGIRSRLLVKITVLAPRRGDPLLVKQLLGEAPMVDAHAAKKAATSIRHAPSMTPSAGGAAAAKAVAQVDAGAAKRGGVKFAEGDDDDDENEELEEPQSGSDSSVDSIRPLKASTLAKMPKAEGGTETRIAGASCPPASPPSCPPARLPPAAFAQQGSTMHSADDSCVRFPAPPPSFLLLRRLGPGHEQGPGRRRGRGPRRPRRAGRRQRLGLRPRHGGVRDAPRQQGAGARTRLQGSRQPPVIAVVAAAALAAPVAATAAAACDEPVH